MILVTNDDGYNTCGIKKLYEASSKITDTIMVAPESMKSASGMSISFSNSIKVNKIKDNINGYYISGYPADCIFIAKNMILKDKKIDLVLSGINYGPNISLISLYASGTVSAAMAGALIGIKGMAFSIVTDNFNSASGADINKAAIITKYIINEFNKNGFPENADVLNINYPAKINNNTKIKVVPMLKNPFMVKDFESDLSNNYRYGNKIDLKNEENSDYHVLFNEKNIAVTPLSVHGHSIRNMDPTIKFFNNVYESINKDKIINEILK